VTHICTTYSEHPVGGECSHDTRERAYCQEHREWHEADNMHDECEACEWERNHDRELTDEELIDRFHGMTGAVCDGHLLEEMYEE
jgi:hypothetical protein